MQVQKIAIGCDHAGFAYKSAIIDLLQERGIAVADFGTDSEVSVDYPDFIHPVAEALGNNEADLGIIMCGSGNGVAMTANKHQHIRAAICWEEELASLAREHNNANVLALPVRFISEALALRIVSSFLDASFEGGRHARRVEKIPYNC